MQDSNFLNWVADRFVHVYEESENVDFVQRLRTLAKRVEQFEEIEKRAQLIEKQTGYKVAMSAIIDIAEDL